MLSVRMYFGMPIYPAMVAAVDSYDPESGAFSTWFMYHLKNAFAEATGYRTKSGRNEPLNHAASLDKSVDDDPDGTPLGEFVSDPKSTATMEAVEEREYQKQLHDALETALGVIPENYSEVLRLRYYQNMTLDECGGALGVGAERVRQMECKGIRILRKPKNAACLRPFYDFDFYCCTGMSAFTHSGMSVQERYLMIEEERQEREEKRRQDREQRRQAKKLKSDHEASMEQLEADVNARISSMTPEEKARLLAKYGYA